MEKLSDPGIHEIAWRYPKTEGGAFELCAHGGTLGYLHFEDRAGAHSVGEFEGRRWTFRYTSGALPRVTIAQEEAAEVVAEYVPWVTGGGMVSFFGGPSYCWNRAKLWSNTWCFRRQGDSHGSSVCLTQDAGPLRDGGKVKLCGTAAASPEMPVLVLLAWYLRVLAFEMLVEAIPGIG
jgi:hypothetical protein